MRLRRLLAMDVRELGERSHQALKKHGERLVRRRWKEDPSFLLKKLRADEELTTAGRRRSDGTGVAEALLDRFRAVVPVRFFEGVAGEGSLRDFEARMPDVRARVITQADAVCEGRFDLLAYRGLSFGKPVDWHLDPVSGRRAPLIHWSRLDPLDPTMVGDSKVVWELNRHQWLVQLGQAYLFTRDERYAEASAGYLSDWLRANPPGRGLNWVSSLEVSLRLIAWCWSLAMLRDSKALTPRLFVALLGGLWAHAAHVERYLSYYFSPNTHLTGEALGLFYAGVLFPEFRRAVRWRQLGARILEDQIERQVHPDGVYFELSTCYQRYTVEFYLHFLILAARSCIPVRPGVADRVRAMLDFLLAVRRPDGSIPQIGDADGGWLMPFVRSAPDDFGALFATAASLFERPDYAWAAGGPRADVLWLLGGRRFSALDDVYPAPPAGLPTRAFPDGGFLVMRNGWDRDAHQVIFDVGPLGCPVSGAHGHADLLSIQCSAFGEPFLVDAGTYGYAAAPEWRDYFRSTLAHSTVVVDGRSQAVPAGPFAWRSRPGARLRHWFATESLDFAEADHDAYSNLRDPVGHRRGVLFVKPRYWLVIDDLDGASQHQIDVCFQFGQLEVTVDAAGWVRARGSGDRHLLIRAFATVPIEVGVLQGVLEPALGWVAPDYGRREPAPMLRCRAVSRLPLRILTLVFPIQAPRAQPPIATLLVDDRGNATGLKFDTSGERVELSAAGIEVVKPGSSDLRLRYGEAAQPMAGPMTRRT